MTAAYDYAPRTVPDGYRGFARGQRVAVNEGEGYDWLPCKSGEIVDITCAYVPGRPIHYGPATSIHVRLDDGSTRNFGIYTVRRVVEPQDEGEEFPHTDWLNEQSRSHWR